MSDRFPFQSYLCTLLHLSPDAVTVRFLDGGLTNHTARATFAEPVLVPHFARARGSVIVKHAPPYIASRGPAQALSPQRQEVEAAALKYFSQDEEEGDGLGLAAVLRRHPRMRVPDLLYHDTERHVLIMSDLGPLPTLLEYLRAHTATAPFAADLGAFLADLHGATQGASPDALRAFENADAAQVLQGLIAPLPGRLLKAEGVPDAEALGRAVELDMATGVAPQDVCFGMVDLWPGSILVGRDFVGLVDWEYAGRSAPGGELGMLTAHLRLPLLSPRLRGDAASSIARFTGELLAAYAAHYAPDARSHGFVRAALLAHGRELINAVEFLGAEVEGEAHRAAAIRSGARCLRAAGCVDGEERQACLGEEERLMFAVFL